MQDRYGKELAVGDTIVIDGEPLTIEKLTKKRIKVDNGRLVDPKVAGKVFVEDGSPEIPPKLEQFLRDKGIYRNFMEAFVEENRGIRTNFFERHPQSDFIELAFAWERTREGHNFWSIQSFHWKERCL